MHRRLLADIHEMSKRHIGGASSYIQKRQLDTEKFNLGYIPSLEAIYNELQEKEWDPEEAFETGIQLGIFYGINKEKHEYGTILRERLIFPIYDPYGRIIAISGRTLKDLKPKYYNTIFKKGDYLYGLHWAAKEIVEKNFVIIVEGYTDVMAAHALGVTNIVATMGTALTKRQCILLARYTSNAFILFDSDTAGERSSRAFLNKKSLHPLLLKAEARHLPDKKDIDELAQANPTLAYEFLTNGIISSV